MTLDLDARGCLCESLHMSTTTEQLVLHLRSLPPEPWGQRLHRARRLHHLTQDEAAERLANYIATTGATISRLESLDEAPASSKRRQLAWALCVSYGVSPDDLDLSDEDRPPLAVTRSLFEEGLGDTPETDDETSPRIHVRLTPAQLSLFACAA